MVFEYIKKIRRFGWYLVSLLIRFIAPIKKGQVLFWSIDFKSYSCNPKYISEYIIQNYSAKYDVIWAFRDVHSFNNIDKSIKKIQFGTLYYLYIINTSEFLITNHRTHARSIYWKKRKGQKYIMTWHGQMALKKIEKDALSSLGSDYEIYAKKDSSNCNLMISDNSWFTETIKRAFWYDGEILEKGVPRNDIFFNVNKAEYVKHKVYMQYNIPMEFKMLLYAPTFRSDHGLGNYQFEWKDFINTLESITNQRVVLLFRLHPTLLQIKNLNNINVDYPFIDASQYEDMQELLVASDYLVTDYSSTMFEFALLKKPCFLLAKDLNTYDRDFYFNIRLLPFIISENMNGLILELNKINQKEYADSLYAFIINHFNPILTPNACKSIVLWMNSHGLAKS